MNFVIINLSNGWIIISCNGKTVGVIDKNKVVSAVKWQ